MQIEIVGNGTDKLTNEAGGHRIQRVPPTETKGRVHTSTVTVAVLNDIPKTDITDQFAVEWFSGSGSGGQHRNKHMNSCRIKHIPTGVVKSAQTRSRENSYKAAMSAIQEELRLRAESQKNAAQNGNRRDQIGTGMRGDKRRTYRFRDDAVQDHITGKSARCKEVMRGNFDVLWPQRA